jgi:hypothetical protein
MNESGASVLWMPLSLLSDESFVFYWKQDILRIGTFFLFIKTDKNLNTKIPFFDKIQIPFWNFFRFYFSLFWLPWSPTSCSSLGQHTLLVKQFRQKAFVTLSSSSGSARIRFWVWLLSSWSPNFLALLFFLCPLPDFFLGLYFLSKD